MITESILEEKCVALQKRLNCGIRYNRIRIPRPFFVEITGTPSAGKTTVITKLDTFFKRKGFRVLCPQEGAQAIRHIERTTPLYSIRTALYALPILINLSQGHLYDIVIFDRCLFDSYCWMPYWVDKKQMTKEEAELYQKFFLLHFFARYLDAVYFMVCDPAIAIAREHKTSLTKEPGRTTNPKTLQELKEYHERAFEKLSPEFPHLYLFDSTNYSEQQMVTIIGNQLIEVFYAKTFLNPIEEIT